MSVLIALFAIICYMCIKGSEKTNNTQYNITRERKKREADAFRDKYFIPYYEVNELLPPDLRSNEELRKIANRIKSEAGVKRPSVDMVILGYLAKIPKIPLDYFEGLRRRLDNEDFEDIHRFAVWYNKELLGNGFEYELKFCWHGAGITEYIPLDGDIGRKRGCYIWDILYCSSGTGLYQHGFW